VAKRVAAKRAAVKYQELHVANLIVQELHGVARDDEKCGPKFKVLKENIEHHIEEEGKVTSGTTSSVRCARSCTMPG
jgi:hypothetical protein